MVLTVIISTVLPCYPKSDEKPADKSKSKYFLLEGLQYESEGKQAAANELFKKALAIDSTNLDASFHLGASIAQMRVDSIGHFKKALALMRPYVDKYTHDADEAKYYAYIALGIHETDEAIRIYERQYALSPDDTDLLLFLAEAYSSKKDLNNEIRCYSEYEKTEGKNQQITLNKINAYLASADTIAAIREADELVASNPENPNYLILKGDVMAFLNMPDNAIEAYKQAEKIAPDNGEAKLAMASYYKHIGDSVTFDRKIYEALLCDDFDLNTKTNLLSDYLATLFSDNASTERGDYLFSVLQDQYPHEETVLDLAARYSAAKEMYDIAAEQISYAIDMNPTNQTYWGQLMTYYLYDDQYAKVEETYIKASDIFSPPQDMTMLLASAYLLDKQLDKATNLYKSLISIDIPDHDIETIISDMAFVGSLSYEQLSRVGTLFGLLGDTYFQQEKISEAFTAYENSLLFFPESAIILNNYAYYLAISNGDLEKAEKLSSKAIGLEPDNPTYIDTYAWILFKKGNYADAKTYQESAIEKCKESPEAEYLDHLGDILFMNGLIEEALDNWKQASEKDPNNELILKKIKHKTYFEE